jgi:DNA polymerase III subunit delta
VSRRPTKKSGLTFEELRQHVKEGRIDPLYLFVGEEQHLQDRAIELLVDTVEEGDRVYNVFFYSVGTQTPETIKVTIARVIDTANERANMFARRVVVVRSFQNINQEESEFLTEYLTQPMPSTALVFQTTSLDKRKKISTALLKFCTVVSFERPNEARIANWAREYLKRQQRQIEPGALSILIELVGNNMMRLRNELDKLSSYADDGVIDNAAVQELVPRAREHASWELWDAIISRDRKRALKLMNRLLDDSDPLPILGSLASYYRKLLIAKELAEGGASKQEITKATNQWSDKFFAGVRRTPRADFVRGLRRIAEVDNAIKNSEATPRLQMEYLIVELTLPGNPQ